MKICHIAPNAPYNDYWGYQENLLPKYQQKMGHEVTLIITNTMHADGRIVRTECADYVLKDGVRVIRLERKKYFHRVVTGMCARLDVYDLLREIKPEMVFFHGLISTTIFDAIRYKKKINPGCVIVQDNHDDLNNSDAPGKLVNRIIRVFRIIINRFTCRNVARIYGVTPLRKRFAEEYYRIPPSKTDVLIMGADDENIDLEHREEIRRSLRNEYGVADDEFFIVTGGKIDKNKYISELMEACGGADRVKLLVFGQVSEDIKPRFDALLKENSNIIYVGWLEADKVYDYFFAADLAFFPGSHSVIWEQACASKVPCVFRRLDGMEHVDNGGNACFLDDASVSGMRKMVNELLFTSKYAEMKAAAESDKTDIYLYSRIAEKSVECAKV